MKMEIHIEGRICDNNIQKYMHRQRVEIIWTIVR